MEIDSNTITMIVSEVVKQLLASRQAQNPGSLVFEEMETQNVQLSSSYSSIESLPVPSTLERMKTKTTARIGVGKAGARMRTSTLLALRADHAIARDAAFLDVSAELLRDLNLISIRTRCEDRNEFLTRPDLGRQFDEDSLKSMRKTCSPNPDVQIIVADGLSSKAIEANAGRILPLLIEGLSERGIHVGIPFFIKFGRVPAMDVVSETVGAKVTCILIGERPGLANPESMSAYVCYNARVGISESRRTVVSNIHRNGISAVEAGAYIVDLICDILKAKASGVDLKR